MKKLMLLALLLVSFVGCQSKEEFVIEEVELDEDSEIVKRLEDTKLVEDSILVGAFNYEEGKYVKMDLLTNSVKEEVFEGYELLNPFQFYGDFLFLQKGEEVFTYSKLTDEIEKIEIPNLKENESVLVLFSYDDENTVEMRVNELDLDGEGGFYGPPIIATKRFVFNADSRELTSFDHEVVSTYSLCERLASNGISRITWPCGEGIGSAMPVVLEDLVTGEKRGIVEGFELLEEPSDGIQGDGFTINDHIGVEEIRNDMLMIYPFIQEEDLSGKVSIVNLGNDFEQMDFSYNLEDFDLLSAYSVILDEESKKIVIGGGNEFQILNFDEDGNLSLEAEIKADKAYANNFEFTDDLIIYDAGGTIFGIDAKTGMPSIKAMQEGFHLTEVLEN